MEAPSETNSTCASTKLLSVERQRQKRCEGINSRRGVLKDGQLVVGAHAGVKGGP